MLLQLSPDCLQHHTTLSCHSLRLVGLSLANQQLGTRLAHVTGCNLAVDVTWKYLNFFMSDDKKLKHIESEYGSGRMLTGEAKAELIKVISAISGLSSVLNSAIECKACSQLHVCMQILQDMVARHQRARALVTDNIVDTFMAIRPMQHVCLPRQ